MSFLRVAYVASLNRAADTLERLAAVVDADLTKQQAIEEQQAQVEAGVTIWAAVLDGFITESEIVDEVEGLAGNGWMEPDALIDNGVHCANLFLAVMREFIYPLGDAVAPQYALIDDEDLNDLTWRPSPEQARMLRREELIAESTGCRIMARMIETATCGNEEKKGDTKPGRPRMSERDLRIQRLCEENNLDGQWAALARLATDDPEILKLNNGEPITRHVARNAVIGNRKCGENPG